MSFYILLLLRLDETDSKYSCLNFLSTLVTLLLMFLKLL